MTVGTAKKFSAENGYGLIEIDGGGLVIVHQAAIEAAGLTELEVGQRFEFAVTDEQDENDRLMSDEARTEGRRIGHFAEDLWPL